MYAEPGTLDAATLYQGDIIPGYPFFILGASQVVERNAGGGFDLAQPTEHELLSLHVIEAKHRDVMILSQSCDVQRRANVVICPVYRIEDLLQDGTLNQARVTSLRGRSIGYWFYLPAHGNFPESLADFQTMIYVPRAHLQGFIPQRTLSLGDLGRHQLAWALSDYFGRPVDDSPIETPPAQNQ